MNRIYLRDAAGKLDEMEKKPHDKWGNWIFIFMLIMVSIADSIARISERKEH